MSKDHDARRYEAVKADTERLKRELLALGAIHIGMADDLPPEQQNQFLRRILALENGATTTLLAELRRIGIEVPPSAGMSDGTLTNKLWEIINGLARLGVFLDHTDHLDDRALYEVLQGEVLPGEMDEMSDDGSVWHVDIIGGGSLEEIALYLKYYADEEYRRSWRAEWPDDDMPAHEDPPHDRDRRLPAPPW